MLYPINITTVITTILYNIVIHIILFVVLILSYPILFFRLLII